MERRLAAILAADVVDYRRLMEADEAGAPASSSPNRSSVSTDWRRFVQS